MIIYLSFYLNCYLYLIEDRKIEIDMVQNVGMEGSNVRIDFTFNKQLGGVSKVNVTKKIGNISFFKFEKIAGMHSDK